VLTNITDHKVISPDKDFHFEMFPVPSDGEITLSTQENFEQSVVTVYSTDGLMV